MKNSSPFSYKTNLNYHLILKHKLRETFTSLKKNFQRNSDYGISGLTIGKMISNVETLDMNSSYFFPNYLKQLEIVNVPLCLFFFALATQICSD